MFSDVRGITVTKESYLGVHACRVFSNAYLEEFKDVCNDVSITYIATVTIGSGSATQRSASLTRTSTASVKGNLNQFDEEQEYYDTSSGTQHGCQG